MLPVFNQDPTIGQQVQANQRGQITSEQRGLLKTESGFNWLGIATPVIILPVIFIGILAALWFFVDKDHTLPLFTYVIVIAVLGVIELVALIPQVWRVITAIRVRSDLAAGQIEVSDGQVVWRRNKYVLQAPTRTLNLPKLSRRLLPGSYRFYFLPSTGFLLSAERLTPPGEDPRAELLGVLAQVNHFSVDALEANRQGRLALMQVGRLLWKFFWYGILWAVLLAVGVGILWSMYTSAHSSAAQGWIFWGGGGVVVVVCLAFAWLLGRLAIDMVRGQVNTIQGPVRRTFTVTHTQHGSSTTYYYQLNKQRFTVSGSAYAAFIDGLQYRIYFVPLSKTLVAIEPL